MIFAILWFGILNALRGAGLIPRWAACVLMAICIGYVQSVNTFAGCVQILLIFGFIWAAFLPGWSLSAITGTFNGKTPEQDWMEKFEPSGIVLNWLDIENPYMAGAVGMMVRFLLFIPAIGITHTGNIPVIIPVGIVFAISSGLYYWLAGITFRNTGYDEQATRFAELWTGMALGVALIV